MRRSVKVRVPGTTANCGPGFDAVGIALTIYNELELSISENGQLAIAVQGEGAGDIPCDESNLVYQAIRFLFQKAGKTLPGIEIKMQNHIPCARGLGSSAAAIVAGLVSANAIIDHYFTPNEILDMATYFEGHPDNVAPAIFGGITVSVMDGEKAQSLSFHPALKLQMVLAIPEFQLSTDDARKVLPKSVTVKDAVFNISRTALLVGALSTGKLDFLHYALEDRIHQPYRQNLIPGMQDVFKAALKNKALGAAISGAGPCLIAFTTENAEPIGKAMMTAFQQHKIASIYRVLDIDREGAKIIP
jgi:homoserine kinase